MNNPTLSWRLPNGVLLVWRRLGDVYVVFNEASGETHVPHVLSEWILRELEISSVTLRSLADKLVRDVGLDRDIAHSRVREGIAELNKMGLVEPVKNSIESK